MVHFIHNFIVIHSSREHQNPHMTNSQHQWLHNPHTSPYIAQCCCHKTNGGQKKVQASHLNPRPSDFIIGAPPTELHYKARTEAEIIYHSNQKQVIKGYVINIGHVTVTQIILVSVLHAQVYYVCNQPLIILLLRTNCLSQRQSPS